MATHGRKVSSRFLFVGLMVVIGQMLGCGGDGVDPQPDGFLVGGTVSGLAVGSTVTLQDNGSDTLSVSTDGGFTFSSRLKKDQPFDVTVSAQPAGQTCIVLSGRGIVDASDVASVAVTCRTFVSQWLDGFESYVADAFPASNWSLSGNTQASTTPLISRAGAQSLFTYGMIDMNWATLVHRQYNWAPRLKISFSVLNGSEALAAAHHFHGSVQLNTGNSWTTPGRGLIFFGSDGRIYAGNFDDNVVLGDVLGSFVSERWYDVTVIYDGSGADSVMLTYFIDGKQVGTYIYPRILDEGSLAYLAVSSGGGSAWFDQVEVSTGQ